MRKIQQKAKNWLDLFAKCNRTFIPQKSKKRVTVLLIFSVLATQSWVFTSWLFGEVINMLSNKTSIFTGRHFVIVALVILIVDLLVRFFKYSSNKIEIILGYQINNLVQSTFWNAYAKYDLQDRESSKMQDAIGNAKKNQNAISEIFSIQLQIILATITLIVATSTLITIQWWYALVVIMMVIPRMYFIWNRKNKSYKQEKRLGETNRYKDSLTSFLTTKDARINQGTDTVLSFFNSIRTKFNVLDLKNNKYFSLVDFYSDQWFFFLDALLLIGLIYQISRGEMQIGVIFVFYSALTKLYVSLVDITQKIITLGISTKKAEDYFLVTEGTPAIIDSINAQSVDNTKPPMIEFIDVWFKYPESEDWILKDCSFKINHGERIGLVAQNGEGKTTVALLLLRFYDVTKGAIKINGIDVRLIKRDTLLAITGVLFQDFKLLEGSVRLAICASNLRKHFSDYEIWNALDTVGIKNHVEQLKHGLNQKISKIFKDSKKLSGGQQQKMGLAGVICKEPKLLILDEFTSALDPVAEQDIVRNYDEISRNKTCLIISHRYNTLDLVDRIIVLQNGTIVENGKKDELLQIDNGVFKFLHNASRLLPKHSLS